MKQFIYLFIALVLNSCVDQGSSEIEFTIFNQTDKKVKIIAFDTKNEGTGIKYKQPFKASIIDISPTFNSTNIGFRSWNSKYDQQALSNNSSYNLSSPNNFSRNNSSIEYNLKSYGF
jgi:hypothetical protein